MERAEIHFSRHAVERTFTRRIPPGQVLQVVREGKIIHSYPDDQPCPGRLLLGLGEEETPSHVVLARDEKIR